MGRNRRLRKGIRSLQDRIREHEDFIAKEKGRFNPDTGLISHWDKEIKMVAEIERKRRRLPGRNKNVRN